MAFKPLAFKYLHQMCSPGGVFTTFNIPTTLEVSQPGFYAPVQGRLWKVSRAVADELFGVAVSAVTVDHYIVETWLDRSSTWHAPQYELMGYALILAPDLDKVIVNGVLAVNIITAK